MTSKASPDSTRYHHGDLRRALLDEAAVMLEQEGVEGISLRSLARRVGVSHAAPGHHFADRYALLAELAADGFHVLHQRLEPPADDHDIEGAGRAYVDFALARPNTFKLMFGGLPGGLSSDDCPPRLREESGRAFLALLRVAGVDVDPAAVEDATYELSAVELRTWSLVHGAATLFVDGALPVNEDEFRWLVDRMLA